MTRAASRRPASAASTRATRSPSAASSRAGRTAIKVEGKELAVSNLDKVLYPAVGFTKGQVIEYYVRIAPAILPHLKARPLTLKRYPNGVDGMFFYEKRCPVHRPSWVGTGKVWSAGNNDYITYCVVDDQATLVWLANLACLEMHTLLSKLPDVNTPTSMVFDLDPGAPADILDSIRIGLKMRDTLQRLGLESFAKVSGSKGLHLWVPLNTPGVTFDRTKEFAHALALLLERENPEQVTALMRKDLRKGKVFIDWSQNDEHKTTACAYTLRARQEPTVSAPVTWEELQAALRKKDPSRLSFRAEAVIKRFEKQGDVFAPVLKLRQRLPEG